MYDFKDVVLPFSVFFILEKLVEKLLFDPLTTICKEQNDKQAQAKRTKKMVANVLHVVRSVHPKRGTFGIRVKSSHMSKKYYISLRIAAS